MQFEKPSVADDKRNIRVKLVDFGVQRIANVSDIGCLNERFTQFPIQSINVCVLNLDPWNLRSWNDDDTRYVTKLLGQNRTDGLQNRYEMFVQLEMEPNVIFTSNLCSTGFDYADTIISKGIARNNTSNNFLQYVKDDCKRD